MCGEKGHYYFTCRAYPSVPEKKTALKAEGRCEDCSNVKKSNHYCTLHALCKNCNGRHKWQLCEANEKTQRGTGQD